MPRNPNSENTDASEKVSSKLAIRSLFCSGTGAFWTPLSSSEKRGLFLGAALACMLIIASSSESADAQDGYWINPGVGDWQDPLNWDPVIPQSSSSAFIDNGGTSQVKVSGPNSRFLTVGGSTHGELEVIEGGFLKTTNHARIGVDASGSGIVRVTGAGSTWDSDFGLSVGVDGTGEVIVSNGGYLEGGAAIGRNPGSSGKVKITGAGSIWKQGPNSSTGFLVGEYDCVGELSVENGGYVEFDRASIGGFEGSEGTVTVSGSNSEMILFDLMRVGSEASGELIVESGGSVDTGKTVIGSKAGSDGAVKVTGESSTLGSTSRMIVGEFGSGKLSIAEGGTATSRGGSIGSEYLSSGEVTVMDSGSKWKMTRELMVGDVGTGKLTISDGGRVESYGTLDPTIIGHQQEVLGIVSITGEGSSYMNAGELRVGGSGFGQLMVSDGATLDTEETDIGWDNDSISNVTITGANSSWHNSEGIQVGVEGEAELTVADGATVTSSLGRIATEFSAGGGFIYRSNGKVTVTGAGSSWSNEGELTVGVLGDAELNITGGGHVSSTGGVIGSGVFQWAGIEQSSNGNVVVSGDESVWSNSSTLTIGDLGEGHLNIEHGGFVSNTAATIGSQQGSTGTVLVTGENSHWQNSSSLGIGIFGSGELTIENGGLVSAESVGLLFDGRANVKFGGTLQSTGILANYGLVDVSAGGILSASGITNYGVLFNEGVINADIQVLANGFASGDGEFNGQVAISEGGIFSPGASPGFSQTQSTTWNEGGAYQWEINSLSTEGGVEGNDPGWDLWSTGDLAINGPFTIALVTLDSIGDPATLSGWDFLQSYEWRIATSTNSAFATIDGLLVDPSAFQNQLGGGSFSLSASGDGNDLFLTFTPVPEPTSLALAVTGLLCLGYRLRKRSLTLR